MPAATRKATLGVPTAIHTAGARSWVRRLFADRGDDSSPPSLAGLMRSAQAHRTTGHAAEMAFFAVLTLVPSTVAVGSILGLSESLIGAGTVTEAQDTAIHAVRTLMGPELADTVVSPFVRAQLSQPDGGVAAGGLLLAWWLSSHLFASTAHALDTVYGVTDR